MRIESAFQTTAVQPVTRLQPIGQTDETAAALKLDLTAFQGQLPGGGKEKDDVAEAVDAVNKAAEPYNISLQFSRDDETGAIIIKMVNQQTGDVLHQIPDEAMLHLSA